MVWAHLVLLIGIRHPLLGDLIEQLIDRLLHKFNNTDTTVEGYISTLKVIEETSVLVRLLRLTYGRVWHLLAQ